MLYNFEECIYEALQPAQTLIAEQLAMLLPAAVAMQARFSLQKSKGMVNVVMHSACSRPGNSPWEHSTQSLQCHTPSSLKSIQEGWQLCRL